MGVLGSRGRQPRWRVSKWELPLRKCESKLIGHDPSREEMSLVICQQRKKTHSTFSNALSDLSLYSLLPRYYDHKYYLHPEFQMCHLSCRLTRGI